MISIFNEFDDDGLKMEKKERFIFSYHENLKV